MTAWHTLSGPEVLEQLHSGTDGIDALAARERLAREGPNALQEAPRPSVLRRLLAQVTDVTVLALLVAAVIAVVIGLVEEPGAPWLERFGDALAIGVIVALNAAIGFIQEQRAEVALRALGTLTAPVARVVRPGSVEEIPAAELVAGDVVLLSEGDRVPADVRLLESVELGVNESALTGESLAVAKDATVALPDDTDLAERRNMAFSGSHVTAGRGRAVVVSTGMQTELGRIAELLRTVEMPDTPLQKNLRSFGLRLVVGCVAVAAIVFVVGLVRTQSSFATLFMTAVSLAVAAIPEGLPAVTTIVLALGVQRMAHRHALVRRLSAVETLGAAQVICTDKTGTLTENRMTVRRVAPVEGPVLESAPGAPLSLEGRPVGPEESDALRSLLLALRYAPAASLVERDGAVEIVGDPTDGALLLLARALALPEPDPVLQEIPFDSARKRATVVVR
jgi:P-type Ca2+ transporter type 2C